MSSYTKTEGTYGPGSYTDTTFTPLPQECARILRYLASVTPGFTTDEDTLNSVRWVGDDLPLIPGPIKSQAITAVLFAMAGIVGEEILQLRGQTGGQLTINTDHAGLFLNTLALFEVDGNDILTLMESGELKQIIPDFDSSALGTPLRYRSQAIYPTKTHGAWYQLHGSTDPDRALAAIGVHQNLSIKTHDEAYEHIKEHVSQFGARELEMKNQELGLCGSICYSPKAWRETSMGQSLAKHPLINYSKQEQTAVLPPVPWPSTQDRRPLAGIKVLELARIIAAPTLGAQLAAFGAEVVRVQHRPMVDLSILQFTLTAGKRTCELNLNEEADRAILHEFMKEADVIIQGYRLGSLERKGFGLNDFLTVANDRGRGVVYLDENCFGPDGYWAEKPGWQQIADAAAGSSYVIGSAYGFKDGESVLPSLPISDLSTGIVGLVTTLMALRDRGKYGGSYHGTAAITAYNMTTLLPQVGLYPPQIVARLQKKFEFSKMTADLHVLDLFLMIFRTWQNKTSLIRNDQFFVSFQKTPYRKPLRILAPVTKFADAEASPHWLDSPVPFCHFESLEWGVSEIHQGG